MGRARRFIAAAIIGTALSVSGLAESQFSLRFTPRGELPLGYSAELYSFGGTAAISGTYRIPFFPILLAQVTTGYAFAQTATGATLGLLPIGIGAGIELRPIPALGLKTSAYGGYYLGMFQATVGGNLFLSADLILSLSLGPALEIGAGVSYSHYFAATKPLFQSLGVTVAATYHIAAAPQPAKIDVRPMTVPPVFPVFHTYYDDHRLGTVILANDDASPVTDIAVSFFMEELMVRPKLSATVDELKAGEKIEVDLYALFSDKILNLTQDTKAQGMVQVEYTFKGNRFQTEKVETIRIHHRNAMTWDDDQKAAAFVTPNDPTVLRFAKSVAGVVRDAQWFAVNGNFRKSLAIFEALSLHGMSYVTDPTTPYVQYSEQRDAVDYLAFPRQSLEFGAGDCDDLSILYAALLQSVGIESAFITVPAHIYVAFSLGIDREDAQQTFLRPEDLIFIGGKSWVPVEITLVQEGFLRAWQVGAQQWREYAQTGAAAFYPLQKAWTVYEPVGLPGDVSPIELPRASDVSARYISVLGKFVDREISPRVDRLGQSIEQSGDGPRQINQLGALYARFGLLDKAAVEFNRAIEQAAYLPALVNLGNLYLIQGKIETALGYFRSGLEIDPDSASVLIGLARASYEQGDYETVRELYGRITELTPSLAERYSYLVAGQDVVTRASEAARVDVRWEEE